jgi:hypothetical protein
MIIADTIKIVILSNDRREVYRSIDDFNATLRYIHQLMDTQCDNQKLYLC